MSSYNENLHSTVVASLGDQESEVQSIEAKKDASMFTLYYAQGARITASEQLNLALEKYDKKERVKHANIVDSNISTNVVASAEVENTLVTQSVTNSAVSAANIEVAANAITKLASDTGSIFSIVNAADYNSQIFDEAQYAKCLMDDTAYLAEKVSQHAMEASALSAEISASSIEEKAVSTDTSIKTLLDVVTSEFNEISEAVDKDNEVLAEAHVIEKKAEGELEDVTGEAIATTEAYQLNNEELNLDLQVSNLTNISYNVLFNRYKSAFTQFDCVDVKKSSDTDEDTDVVLNPYPVKNYYIMLVKDNKKSTFTVNTAQANYKKDNRSVPAGLPIIPPPNPQTTTFDIPISITELYDSDGEELKLGEEYVVFVYAILDDDYKKTINNFDDYITAPSATFKLTTVLEKAFDIDVPKDSTPQELKFNVKQESFVNVEDIEYRCMFLPSDEKLTKGLLTQAWLNNLEGYAEYLEKMASDHDKQYAKKQSQMTLLKVQMKARKQYLANNPIEVGEDAPSGSKGEDKYLLSIREKITNCQAEIDSLNQIKGGFGTEVFPPIIDSTDRFLFNLCVAEQVPAGSYKAADIEYDVINEENEFITGSATVKILPDITDNFGNRLMDGHKYIPVILSINVGDNKKEYTNALTDYGEQPFFVYKNDTSDGTILSQLNHALEDIEEVKEELEAKKKNKKDKKDKK
ncbi:hypothetical protein [uncultured Winogradskyella sp.]|uniref:hypothetical protein n=1 Tax=uncultured Winogradskyella sp. TaxID=395353 RepID=UPI00261CE61F|nr:hypothetical protein [uncultured Winogradskyella sp.]